MTRIVLIFGLISGAVAGLLMWILFSYVNTGSIDFDNGIIWGYATMIIALSMVFFGVKSYRDNNGGRISFLKGSEHPTATSKTGNRRRDSPPGCAHRKRR